MSDYRVGEYRLAEQTDKARAMRTQKPFPAVPSGIRTQTSEKACLQGPLGGVKERISLNSSEAKVITGFNFCQSADLESDQPWTKPVQAFDCLLLGPMLETLILASGKMSKPA